MKRLFSFILLCAAVVFASCDKDNDKTSEVPVTGVTIDQPTLSIVVDGTATLVATIAPAEATNKAVTWSSDKTDIATVSDAGVVTGKAAGTATITITTADGNKTATCQVTVNEAVVAVTGVTLNPTTASIEVGETVTLASTVAPANATNKAATWSSDKTDIATVSDAGVVTGKAAGTATITITTADGNKTATCQVTVSKAVTSVTLNKTDLSLLQGDKETLTVTVVPADFDSEDVTWSSSDETVATVSATGEVTAVKTGWSTITATAGSKSVTCVVDVVPPLTATASTNAFVVGNEGGASFAIDGNMDTYWAINYQDNPPLPHWVCVDLGVLCEVYQIEMWRRSGTTNGGNDIKTCILQLSVDGSAWSDVETYSYSIPEDKYRITQFDPSRKARYVRYYITESNRPPQAAIAEIIVGRKLAK